MSASGTLDGNTVTLVGRYIGVSTSKPDDEEQTERLLEVWARSAAWPVKARKTASENGHETAPARGDELVPLLPRFPAKAASDIF